VKATCSSDSVIAIVHHNSVTIVALTLVSYGLPSYGEDNQR
jgi:hypothetical protein